MRLYWQGNATDDRPPSEISVLPLLAFKPISEPNDGSV